MQPVDSGAPSLQSLLDAISGASPPLAVPHAMSNALVVSGAHTKTGRPIAVFGPQTGYFVPQLLVEKDVHGPDIDARGVAFAGTDLIVQLGRGRNYAFSATSAGADNVDQWVLKLCEPGGGPATTSSMGYLHNGTCVPIEAYDQTELAKPSAGGPPATGESGGQCANNTDDDFDGVVNDGCPAMGAPEVGPQCLNNTDDDGDGVVNDGCPAVGDVVLTFHVERTPDYGPLVARGKLTDGTPIAVATLRSTYRHELDSARGFIRINNPNFMTDGYNSFRQAMGTGVDYTFNWFYVDAKDIGYQHSCKCPQRAQGVDPYLPVWGTGQWDWQGFIPFSAQPNDLNPPAGFLTSWNNKQAPQFKANDRQFSYGPVFRNQLLVTRIQSAIAAGPIDRADLVSAMEDAGTCDLRGQEDLPLLLQVLGPTAPGGADPRAQEMRDRLAAWVTTQTHRRDFDHDGSYDDPEAPAIIDAWWTRLSHAMFDANSGNAIQNLGLELDDGNRRNHIGDAFDDSFYGQPNKDLRQVLGMPAPGGADPRAQEMRDRLAAWVTTQTHRRDFDHDGSYDDPEAPAIIDAWWTRLSHAMFDANSGNAIQNLGLELDDGNRRNHIGDAFDDSFYGQPNKDLRQMLGMPVTDPWSRTYCGNGVLADCRTALWNAMSQAAADLQAEFSSANVADWKRLVTDEDVRHTTVGVTGVPAIHWINRPTFQQVVQIPATEHFKCYRARAAVAFAPVTVTLTDQFGTRTTSLRRPDSICNPVDKNGEGIADPATHLACYRLRDATGHLGAPRVTLTDQFGGETFTLTSARTLCLPSTQDGVPFALSIDRFRCYSAARPTPPFGKRTVTLADVFETKTTTVMKPQLVCDAVDENGTGVRDATARLVCHKIRDAAGQTRFAPHDATVANELGSATLTAIKASSLCVPAAQQ
ncbi:MAG: penicillin acylase family protein [Deltaproteobacteria bacterium]|nr:MAG: penicillin acylase family protein [Deltaproteobacteria bacterium]